MIKRKLKDEKGALASDAIIAVLIFLIFSGFIISLIYNLIFETYKVKISSKQQEIATDVFEYIEKNKYDDITEENLINFVNENYSGNISAGTNIENLDTKYKIGFNIQKYNETTGNTEKYDFIKTIKITILSELQDKEYKTEISTLKQVNLEEAKQILKNVENEE